MSQSRNELIEENMNLVYFMINKHYPTFRNDEDIVQCGMLGLIRAADTWDESKSKFSTYASHCIINEIRREFKRRRKHDGLYSLDYIVEQDHETFTLLDTLPGDGDVILDYISHDIELFYNKLSPFEKKVYNLKEQGESITNIAKKLNCSRDKVYSHLRRMNLIWRDMHED